MATSPLDAIDIYSEKCLDNWEAIERDIDEQIGRKYVPKTKFMVMPHAAGSTGQEAVDLVLKVYRDEGWYIEWDKDLTNPMFFFQDTPLSLAARRPGLHFGLMVAGISTAVITTMTGLVAILTKMFP